MYPLPKFNSSPLKMMVGRLISYWEGNFSGAMLSFGRVYYVMLHWFHPTSTWAPEILLADPCFNHRSGQRNAVVDGSLHFSMEFCLSLLFWRKGTLLWKKHISRQFSRWFSELPQGGICKIPWRICAFIRVFSFERVPIKIPRTCLAALVPSRAKYLVC